MSHHVDQLREKLVEALRAEAKVLDRRDWREYIPGMIEGIKHCLALAKQLDRAYSEEGQEWEEDAQAQP